MTYVPLVTGLALWLQHRTGGSLHVWLLGGVWTQELRCELPSA